MWEPWSSKVSPVILEGLGSSLNDGMVNPTGAHFQVLNALDTAMAPSEIIAIVERCPSWRASGLFVRGRKVRKVQPKKEGACELEYGVNLTGQSKGDQACAAIRGETDGDAPEAGSTSSVIGQASDASFDTGWGPRVSRLATSMSGVSSGRHTATGRMGRTCSQSCLGFTGIASAGTPRTASGYPNRWATSPN